MEGAVSTTDIIMHVAVPYLDTNMYCNPDRVICVMLGPYLNTVERKQLCIAVLGDMYTWPAAG